MSERNGNTPLTILRIANVSRAIVLFTMVGLSSVFYYGSPDITLWFFLLLVLDFLGLLVLMIPKMELLPIGYVWAGLMSIGLIFYVSQFLGNTYFFSDVLVVLLLASIQLLALLKIGVDIYAAAAQEPVTS